jgi:hypothetical protein
MAYSTCQNLTLHTTGFKVQDDTQTTIRRTTTDDQETEIGVPGSDQRDTMQRSRTGSGCIGDRSRGSGHKTTCKDEGGSGSEPTRLKFAGIQTGRGTQGGAPALAGTTRIIRFGVGAQGGAQALAVCQDRSEVEDREGRSTTRLRCVGRRTRRGSGLEVEMDQSIEKVFCLRVLRGDGGERLRLFPPKGARKQVRRGVRSTSQTRTRNQTTKARGKDQGIDSRKRGSGRTESRATADSRRDQDDPIRRQLSSVRYRYRKVGQRFDIRGFGGCKEFLGILGSGSVSWTSGRRSKMVQGSSRVLGDLALQFGGISGSLATGFWHIDNQASSCLRTTWICSNLPQALSALGYVTSHRVTYLGPHQLSADDRLRWVSGNQA